jgi:AIG2 family protein
MSKTSKTSSVWYFAYGSNMQSATFRGRRGIGPFRAQAGRLQGWRLVFDKPPLVPVGESFANIVLDPAAEVLGVLYEISPADLEHVDLTEGVLIGNYRRVPVPVEPLGDAATAVEAFTLTSERRDSSLRPSIRYLQALVEGAREHGLPESYVTWLASVPGGPETEKAVELRSFLDQALNRPRS